MSAQNLSQSQIRGEFALAYNQSPLTQMVNAMAVRVPASARLDVFGIVGRFPRLRRRLGSLATTTPPAQNVTIENIRYHAAEAIDIDDYRRDQTTMLRNRVNSAAQSAAAAPFDVIKRLVLANTATAYTGSTLFNASHTFGGSGAQTNILSTTQVPALGAVATANAPTPEEIADVILNLKGYTTSLLDHRGEQMFDDIRGMTFVVPGNLEGAFRGAINANNLAGGRTNAARQLADSGVAMQLFPRQDWFTSASGAVFYAIVDPGEAAVRPFILTEDQAPTVDFVGEGSEHATKHDEVLVKASWVGGVGVGEPLTIFQCTMS